MLEKIRNFFEVRKIGNVGVEFNYKVICFLN